MSEGGLSAVVAQHYNQIEEKGLKARARSHIFHLRNFNNWIKSMLIYEFVQKCKADDASAKLSVLDIGAGKGGDLMKWKKNDIVHLVCADIAATSVAQCQERFREMKARHIKQNEKGECYECEFIVADCTKELLKEKYKDPAMQFDIVSCQFAFHYCFESLPQARIMIQNASESLKPGGYFIGTTLDAYDIMRRLEEASESDFGNDVYNVKFPSKDKEQLPLFGAKYNFQLESVVDCPEFLVYFPTLVKLAKECGNLELVLCEKFDSYFQKCHTITEGAHLLTRMHALETYPPLDGNNLMGGEDEYVCAEEKCDSLRTEKKPDDPEIHVGTLTKSEWEIASMYLVFAFKKVGD